MEIHAPDRPVHGWRDFVLHIAIVTIGILIALGLDGLREHFHDQHLVRDARENIRAEMDGNLSHSMRECGQVNEVLNNLNPLVTNLAGAAQDPERIPAALAKTENPYYFFSATSWQAALSTGALAHMKTDEVSAYADAAEVTRIYTTLQQQAVTAEARTKAFFAANPHPSREALPQGLEQLAEFAHMEQMLVNVCPQMQRQVRRAIAASDGKSQP